MPAFRKVKKDMKEVKITDELIKNICKYLKSGAYVETAVIMAGVGKTTFYRWIKASHKAEKEAEGRKLKKNDALKVKLRNAVGKAIEESTMIDLANIQKCAIGKKPVYDRYPEGTILPARDDKGKVQLNNRDEEIMIDMSGQIVTDYKGKPIIADQGLPPDWKASAWRLEKRDPSRWGSGVTETEITKPIENNDEGGDTIEIVFVAPEENK